eukprot:579280-Amphidinium_carterae.1
MFSDFLLADSNMRTSCYVSLGQNLDLKMFSDFLLVEICSSHSSHLFGKWFGLLCKGSSAPQPDAIHSARGVPEVATTTLMVAESGLQCVRDIQPECH